jgi:uracil-DNA glycosylase
MTIKKWGDLPFYKDDRQLGLIDKLYEEQGTVIDNGDDFGWPFLPAYELVHRAFTYNAPKDVKVVILGQDPYPTPGYANGLAFSVSPHVKVLPRSLQNIFKELIDDLGVPVPANGDLTAWAEQGVLLLNTCLTVTPFAPGSHLGYGWEELAKEVITELSNDTSKKVFILWGKHARSYKNLIDTDKHLVIESAHPSPLSAHYGFFGSKPFSKANAYLGKTIDWRL